jgi:hypothetical protein
MFKQRSPQTRGQRQAVRRRRTHQVKIVPFVLVHSLGSNLPQAERLIEDYLSQGWRIVAAGGAGGDGGGENPPWANGFIVLYRDNTRRLADQPQTSFSVNGSSS